MVDRGHKPGLLAVSRDTGHASGVSVESDSVKLSLPSGESAEVLLYGATVVSWKAGGEERLFLSDKAKLDGSKAVRGGIPLVFPVFGKTTSGATSTLPQHGFARTSNWELLGKVSETEMSVQVDFGLGPENLNIDARKQWPFGFSLIYSVILSQTTLETKLLVGNEGGEAFDFNALFHTYLRVPDVTALTVEGLKGVSFKDKLQQGAEATEDRDALTIAGEVDRVYANVPAAVTVKHAQKTLFTVERSNLSDVVVWNPWEGSSGIADFGPADGYKNMICVEAGAVSAWQTLEPQNIWEGGVTVSL